MSNKCLALEFSFDLQMQCMLRFLKFLKQRGRQTMLSIFLARNVLADKEQRKAEKILNSSITTGRKRFLKRKWYTFRQEQNFLCEIPFVMAKAEEQKI